jgi:hypothetical protein
MKMINCNNWASRNRRAAHIRDIPVPITNPLIANRNNLYYNFHTYNIGGVACVYRNLSLFL